VDEVRPEIAQTENGDEIYVGDATAEQLESGAELDDLDTQRAEVDAAFSRNPVRKRAFLELAKRYHTRARAHRAQADALRRR
jgi:hypothetical protein